MARQIRNADGEWVDAPVPVVDPAHVDQRADGSLRRAGAGTRTMSNMFDEKNRDRTLLRGEYVNLRASEEYARRERKPWRRLWRWLRGWPSVVDINAEMANAHARSLDAIRRALELKQQQEDDAAQVRALADYNRTHGKKS